MRKFIMIELTTTEHTIVSAILAAHGVDLKTLVETNLPKATESDWMTRQEAADHAKVSVDTIDNWRTSGRIKAAKTGDAKPASVRILRSSLDAFLQRSLQRAGKNTRRKGVE